MTQQHTFLEAEHFHTGDVFGTWEVIAFDHRWLGQSVYRCRCRRCGAVALMSRSNLQAGKKLDRKRCRRCPK